MPRAAPYSQATRAQESIRSREKPQSTSGSRIAGRPRRGYTVAMGKAIRSPARRVALACFFLAASRAPADGFASFISAFKDIQPPASLNAVLDSWGTEDPLIPLDAFESFILAPAKGLAASRPGPRSLEGWGAWIRDFKRFVVDLHLDDGILLEFRASGRMKAKGFIIAAVSCFASYSAGDGGESYANRYLLSFAPSGRLVDAMPFMAPAPPGAGVSRRPAVLPWRDVRQDPVNRQGDLGAALVSLDGRGRIIARDRYMLGDLAVEIDEREIGVSAEGAFVEASPERRFLLSAVYKESGAAPGILRLYGAEDRGEGGPTYLAWIPAPADAPVEAAAGRAPDGSLSARSDSGREIGLAFSADGGSAVLSDGSGAKRSLSIERGPGKNGEETALSGILWLGDHYVSYSRNWTYLFAPALLPLASYGGQAIFAARSSVFGIVSEGNSGSRPDEGMTGGEASVGTLVEGSGLEWEGNRVAFAPGSRRWIAERRVVGKLAEEAFLVRGATKIRFSAGTVLDCSEAASPGPGWAVISAESEITERGLAFTAPAGSTIRFSPAAIEGVAFSRPVTVRSGSIAVKAAGVSFPAADPDGFAEVSAVEIVKARAGGKAVALADVVSLDAEGNARSGRLSADVDLDIGGKTVRFRGGYDPEAPDAGIIRLYPGGRVRSGTLAAAAAFRIGNTAVSLVPGDSVSFGVDGLLESCAPDALAKIESEGAAEIVKAGTLVFAPDGSVRSGNLFERNVTAAGGLRVSSLLAACVDRNVRARLRPALGSETVGFLNKGDMAAVIEKSAEKTWIDDASAHWYLLRRLSDGQTGWSYGRYLRVEE
jgi:hypothetical protein